MQNEIYKFNINALKKTFQEGEPTMAAVEQSPIEQNMGVTPVLLLSALNRGVVESSNMLSNAAIGNHTSQINNHARCGEMLSKRICELDEGETVSSAEMFTRYSPISQAHGTASDMAQLGAVIQGMQNQSAQGFLQLKQSIDALISVMAAKAA
jgi:hypothetical protein